MKQGTMQVKLHLTPLWSDDRVRLMDAPGGASQECLQNYLECMADITVTEPGSLSYIFSDKTNHSSPHTKCLSDHLTGKVAETSHERITVKLGTEVVTEISGNQELRKKFVECLRKVAGKYQWKRPDHVIITCIHDKAPVDWKLEVHKAVVRFAYMLSHEGMGHVNPAAPPRRSVVVPAGHQVMEGRTTDIRNQSVEYGSHKNTPLAPTICSSQTSGEKSWLVEDVINLRPYQATFLGILQAREKVQAVCPMVKFFFDHEVLKMSAPKVLMARARSDVLSFLLGLTEKKMQVSASVYQMYRSTAAQEKINRLIERQGLICSWKLQDGCIVVISSKENQKCLDDIFRSTFTETAIKLGEDEISIVRSGAWQSFMENIRQSDEGQPAPVLLPDLGNNVLFICDTPLNIIKTRFCIQEFFDANKPEENSPGHLFPRLPHPASHVDSSHQKGDKGCSVVLDMPQRGFYPSPIDQQTRNKDAIREVMTQEGLSEELRTVEVTGLQEDDEEMCRLYFENSKRSGGGELDDDNGITWDWKNQCFLLTFADNEVAKRVVSRDHHLKQGIVQVKLHSPPFCSDDWAHLMGVPGGTSEDHLKNYLECVADITVTALKSDKRFGEAVENPLGRLYPRLSQPANLLGSSPLKGYKNCSDMLDTQQRGFYPSLTNQQTKNEDAIREVMTQEGLSEVLRTVEVTGLQEDDEEMCRLYFENSKRSGGGELDDDDGITWDWENQCFLLTFADIEVAKRVVSRDHHLKQGIMQVKLHSPPFFSDDQARLMGVPRGTSKDHLKNYLECVADITVTALKSDKRSGEAVENPLGRLFPRVPHRASQMDSSHEKGDEGCSGVLDKPQRGLCRDIRDQQTRNKDAFREVTTQEGLSEELRTVEVTGLQEDDEEMCRLYFENSKRSDGGEFDDDDGITWDWENQCFLLTFADSEVAKRVVSRDHHLKQGIMRVKLHSPPICYDDRVRLMGVPRGTSEDHLWNYLECVADISVTAIKLDMRSGEALVMMEPGSVDLKYFRQACKTSPLDSNSLLLFQSVPVASKTVIVSNLNPVTTMDCIVLFFENRKRNAGGSVTSVEMLDDTTALVHFAHHEDAESVVRKGDHFLDGRLLLVKVQDTQLVPTLL